MRFPPVSIPFLVATALSLVLPFGACANIGDDGAIPASAPADAAPAPPTDIDPADCQAPDLMVVLDRSGSMSQKVDGTMPPNTPEGAEQTKWFAAVTILETLAEKHQGGIRFGLSLFPEDPEGAGGYDCSNLDTWLAEYLPPETDDAVCAPAELVVTPEIGSASSIADAIDVRGTGLCSWTPIGAGLASAGSALAAARVEDRHQYAVLITDGADNCDGRDGYSTMSLAEADALYAAGVRVFVVGFDGSGDGIDPAQLNDLACAGGTALDFDQSCTQEAGGGYRAAVSPDVELFLLADDAATLEASLKDISSEICCDCVIE